MYAKLGPQPTPAQIAAAETAVAAAQEADATAQAQAVAVLKAAWPTMTPVQKAIVLLLKKHEAALKELS